MKPVGVILLSLLVTSSCSAAASEPVLGGPCDGCELVFQGEPERIEARARIAPLTEDGEPLVIAGTVRTSTGAPAAGVIVYAYHTDRTGIYPKGETRHGRLRGWVRTGSDGSYRFDTIRPGAYPSRDIPQHVHMHVIEPGKGTYYIDEIVFDDDPLLDARHRRSMVQGRGGSGLAVPTKDDKGVWHVERDIVLGKEIPDYK